jgi:hypothetical protein
MLLSVAKGHRDGERSGRSRTRDRSPALWLQYYDRYHHPYLPRVPQLLTLVILSRRRTSEGFGGRVFTNCCSL